MLTDAHCHLENNQELANLLIKKQITTIVNCQTPEEWHINQKLTRNMEPLSFGIHPWDANRLTLQEVLPYLEQADVVGEIGLDSVWTENSLDCQKEVFTAQIEWAQASNRPVILHTKGCEKTILATIRQFPNRYLIHWYDCSNYQREYVDLNCYFSFCLAILDDANVIKLAKKVPLNRLLIETDGLSSVEWLENKPVKVEDYPLILDQTLTALADLRQVDKNMLTKQVAANLQRFLGK